MASSITARFGNDITELLNFQELFLGACVQNPKLGFHLQLVIELAYCRFVDRYLLHVSEVLTALFTLRPEMLRSNEKVEIQFILEHTSMEELVKALIERKVTALAFEGMRKLAHYFDGHLKIPLFDTDEQLEVGVLAVELRNLFTHNQGVVNRLFKQRVPGFDCTLGERLNLIDAKYSPKLSTIHSKALAESAISL